MMNVLSLFDGIGCGRIALDRAGIPVNVYFASETDDIAKDIATANYADITEIGDVKTVAYVGNGIVSEIGFQNGAPTLLIGSNNMLDGYDRIHGYQATNGQYYPITSLEEYMNLKAQGLSFKGEAYLFWEYVRVLRQSAPKYFLYENVKVNKELQAIITEALGVEPIEINSSLVSAQNRARFYWTNIPMTELPEDRQIYLTGILDPNADNTDISDSDTVQKSFWTFLEKYGYIPECFNAYNATEITSKAPTLSRGSMVTSSCAVTLFVAAEEGTHVVMDGIFDYAFPIHLPDGNYNIRRLSIKEMERLQTIPEGYVDNASTSISKKGQLIGTAWTVDVIAWILSFIPEEDR